MKIDKNIVIVAAILIIVAFIYYTNTSYYTVTNRQTKEIRKCGGTLKSVFIGTKNKNGLAALRVLDKELKRSLSPPRRPQTAPRRKIYGKRIY